MRRRRLLPGVGVLVALATFQGPGAACRGQEPKAALKGNGGGVWAVTFSPDGKTLASAGAAGIIELREAPSLRLTSTIKTRYRPILHLAFSPDGKILAAAGGDAGRADGNVFSFGAVTLWDVPAGRLRATFHGRHGRARAVAFSPDAKTLATGLGASVWLWEVETGKERARLDGHRRYVHAVAFSPDGRVLASGDADGSIVCWDLLAHKERARLRGPDSDVVVLAFTDGGKRLLSLTWGGTAVLWDAGTGRQQRRLKGAALTQGGALSPDGSTLAKAQMDGWIWLVDLREGTQHAALEWEPVCPVAFSPDGRLLAAGGADGAVRLWDVRASLKAGK
jgi:WD40 repeat protein